MQGSQSFHRPVVLFLVAAAILAAGALVQRLAADGPTKASPRRAALAPAAKPGEEVATLAGGCFWCLETGYEGMPGVRAVISGYTGGHKEYPKYEEVGGGKTGHYEAVRVYYDPKKMSYHKVLEIFWHSVDPTQADGQFCDRGDQYRSAIFYDGDAQRRIAEETRRRLETSSALGKPIVTEILAAGPFYVAEEYHQDFWKKDPVRYQSYRLGCGRDRQLQRIWGARAAKPSAH